MARYEALPLDNQFDLGDASDSDDDSRPQSHAHAHDNTTRAGSSHRNRPSSPASHPLLPSPDSPPASPSTHHTPGTTAIIAPRPVPGPFRSNEVLFDASGTAGAGEEDEDDSYMHPPPTPPGGFHYPPPPGSPPPLGRASGNTNGVPIPASYHAPALRPSVLSRALGAILPTHYAPRSMRIIHPQGGGMRNDGVFANMSAKPDGRNGMVRGLNEESDNPDWVPEIASNQPPPSYLTAQADSVPPYYETGLAAGTPFTGPISPNASLLIDNLPPGSLFSFLWNLLVSLSFQFVGFLLTYLLHTSHAAKQGSRAGLGITLIQYGFYLRQRAESMAAGGTTLGADGLWHTPAADDAAPPSPSFPTAAQADAYYKVHNDTLPSTPALPLPDANTPVFPHELSVANEWLSFFLMTIGWFVLLTSVLSYWRVKRWESNVRRQAAERVREEAAAEAAALAALGGPATADDTSSAAAGPSSAAPAAAAAAAPTAPAEPERRRMAWHLNAFVERVAARARVDRLLEGWARVPTGPEEPAPGVAARAGRRAERQRERERMAEGREGRAEEGLRLEAVD